MSRSRLGAITAALLAMAAATPAFAHGDAPAALAIAGDDGHAPWAVVLSRGLGYLGSDGQWRYLCGAFWDGPEAPLLNSPEPESVWIVGHSEVFRLDAGGGVTSAGLADFAALPLRRLVSHAGWTYGLAPSPSGSSVWRIDGDGAEELWADGAKWTSIASDGVVLHLAGTDDDGTLRLATLDGQGSELERSAVDAQAPDATPSLRVAGGDLFGVLSTPDGWVLGRIDGPTWTELLASDAPIHGPLQVGEARFVVTGGELLRLEGDAGAFDASRRYTCLSESASGAWICTQRDIWPLTEEGVGTDPVFSMDELGPPPLEDLEGDRRFACRAQWTDFANDGGLDPRLDELDSADPSSDPGGCATAPGRDVSARAIWLLVLASLIRGRALIFGQLTTIARARRRTHSED